MPFAAPFPSAFCCSAAASDSSKASLTEAMSGNFPPATSAATFDAMRDEAGISRLYGGIHYTSDIETGKDHGGRIGGYTVAFAEQDGAN